MNQKLLEFIAMSIEGGAAITIHYCEPGDSRTKALIVSELFADCTGATVEEVQGKFRSHHERITFLHNYYDKDGVTIVI